MTTRTRLFAAMLAALISIIGTATLAFAQDPDDCYPVPVEDCEVPTDEEPDMGVLPDTDDNEDEDQGVLPPGAPSSPSGEVGAAGEAPVVQAQTALAQTGMPAAVLLAVIGVTMGSGAVLLLTTRRRTS